MSFCKIMVDCVASRLMVRIHFGSTASLNSHLGMARNPRLRNVADRQIIASDVDCRPGRIWLSPLLMAGAPKSGAGRTKQKAPSKGRGQVREMNIKVGTPPPRTVQPQFGFVADLRCAENKTRRGRSFGFAPAFPSAAGSYQALTFYPALIYGFDSDRIDSANFRIIGIGDRGLSGIVYRIKVARVCSKQGRHNAWEARFGKIADAEFHARKIKRRPPIGNGCPKAQRRFRRK
jgi:hypothetical protein